MKTKPPKWVLTITEPREGTHILLFDNHLSALAHVERHYDLTDKELDAFSTGQTLETDNETLTLAKGITI